MSIISSTGIRGSESWAVTTSQKARSVRSSPSREEPDPWDVRDPVEHDSTSQGVPVLGRGKDVVVGVAAAHLRGRAAALRGHS